jgi:Sucrase/ferredoxin-like
VPEAPPCATLSRALGEPLLGTASLVRGWVLLEQPGPWGREAVLESRLDRDLAVALDRRAHEVHARLLLIRRPGRGDGGGGRCFVAHTGRRDRWVEGRVLDDPAELLDLDFGKVVAGERPGFGGPVPGPLYLVCTNGRHDRCCATYGRPLGLALAATAVGERVWECSHVGGDRFAANLVCLPGGHYFGRVGAQEAADLAGRYERGLLDLDHYRGRCCDPWAVQAAEWFARRHSGLLGVDGLVVEGSRRLDREVSAVRFVTAGGGRLTVVVRAARTADPRLLTCSADDPQPPMAYTLLALEAGGTP